MEHQGWAIDTLLSATTERTKSPNNGHAIGCGDIGGIENLREIGIVFGQNDAVHRGHTDIVAGNVWLDGSFGCPLSA